MTEFERAILDGERVRVPAEVIPMPPNPVIVTIDDVQENEISQGLSVFVIRAHDENQLPWTFTTIHKWRASLCSCAMHKGLKLSAQWQRGQRHRDKELADVNLLENTNVSV